MTRLALEMLSNPARAVERRRGFSIRAAATTAVAGLAVVVGVSDR